MHVTGAGTCIWMGTVQEPWTVTLWEDVLFRLMLGKCKGTLGHLANSCANLGAALNTTKL